MPAWRSAKYRLALFSNLVALGLGFIAGLMWIPKLVSSFGLAGKFLVVTAVIVLLLWMVRFFEGRAIKD
jgi:ethanolamine transporter EutH